MLTPASRAPQQICLYWVQFQAIWPHPLTNVLHTTLEQMLQKNIIGGGCFDRVSKFFMNVTKIILSRCQIFFYLKCTKFNFSWGSTTDPAGEFMALPRLLVGFGEKGGKWEWGRGRGGARRRIRGDDRHPWCQSCLTWFFFAKCKTDFNNKFVKIVVQPVADCKHCTVGQWTIFNIGLSVGCTAYFNCLTDCFQYVYNSLV